MSRKRDEDMAETINLQLSLRRVLGNQQGSIILVALLVLSLITILGLATSKTTVIEMQISSNDKVRKQNFYQAEGAAAEAMQFLEDNDLKTIPSPPWLVANGGAVLSSNTELTDVFNDGTWVANSQDPRGIPGVIPPAGVTVDTRMMAKARGIAAGSSGGMGGSQVYLYDLYGRSTDDRGQSIVKITYKKAF